MFNLRYRPSSFTDFIGNEGTINGLLSSFPNWPTAFLITGPPGVGKTTLGRIIAKQLQCDSINLKEIDAGQERGIDTIRQIINSSYQKPLIGKIKVYIFDECQGLTPEAQQALLKVTEESPKNTYFIFCSTDPQKIIKALKARCQQGFIQLNTLSNKELGIIIKNIVEKEKIEFTDLVKEIAKLCIYNADGIPRNAIMMFEKFYRYTNIVDVTKELEIYEDKDIPEEIWGIINALDNGKLSDFINKFSLMKRGNFESFRITCANIFKKKLQKALIKEDKENIEKYIDIMSIFEQPVNNQLGDIELTARFGRYIYITNYEVST